MNQAETFEWLRARSNRLAEVEAEVERLRAENERLQEKIVENREQQSVEFSASENLRAQLAAAEERVKELQSSWEASKIRQMMDTAAEDFRTRALQLVREKAEDAEAHGGNWLINKGVALHELLKELEGMK